MNIINAKFSPTTLDKTFIQRSELVKEMASNNNKRVMLITAPAGYGKTTLLSQFSGSTDEKVMWYHLDAFDNEIITFMTYFTEGLSRIIEKPQENIIPLLNQRLNQGDIKGPVADLLNYLAQNIYEPLCIILDDFHYLDNNMINELLSIFIKYMPSNVRILIASRTFPAINLDFMITSNSVLEINMEQLRFSIDEEQQFMDNSKLKNQPEIKSDLIKKNNGWPFGLNLLQYAVRENIDENYGIQELYSKCFDNIYDEFIDKQFLTETCLLEVLDVEACNFVTGRADAKETLKDIFRKGLFISRTHSGGYKYHDLFRDYLISKLDNKEQAYKRISEYYKEKNNELEAINYSILAEDFEGAEIILRKNQYKFISVNYYIQLYHWEKNIPKKIADRFGGLSLVKAFIAFKTLEKTNGEYYLINAEKIFNNNGDKFGISKTEIIRVKLLRMQNRMQEAYNLANDIYNYSIEKPLEEKIDILTEKVHISTFLCKVDEELLVLKNETINIDENNIKPYEIQALALLEYAAYLIGEYRVAMDIQNKYRKMVSPLNSIVYTIRIYMVWGKLEDGKRNVLREIENAKRYGLNNSLPELYGILAEVEFHLGRYSLAEEYFIKSMKLFDDTSNNLYYLCIFTYINMLAFLGKNQEALNSIKKYYPKIKQDNYLGFMMADMMLCQTYLILKDYDNAIEYAQKALVPSKLFGTKLYIATINSVIATAYLEKGEEEKAYEYASIAMNLSENGFYIQDFITYYNYYKPLFQYCINNNINTVFIDEIINAAGEKSLNHIDSPDILYVRFFGDNTVRLGEKLLKWRTIKAKNIFCFLVYYGESGISKEKLMDVFFENYDLEKANNNLRTTLTYIRKALKEIGLKDIIQQLNGRYYIKDKNINSDLVKFNNIIERFKVEEEDLTQLAKELCEVYKGPFCEDIDVYLFDLEKDKYQKLFQTSILKTIENLKSRNKFEEALSFINILIQHNKYNEELYTIKSELYELMGDTKSAEITRGEIKRIEEN